MIAPMLCIPSPKTRSRVRRPHASVIHCLSQISRMISRNMARKMMIANTCANICILLFSHNRYPHQKLCRYHLSFVSDAKSQSPVLLPILTVNIGNHEISLSGTVLMSSPPVVCPLFIRKFIVNKADIHNPLLRVQIPSYFSQYLTVFDVILFQQQLYNFLRYLTIDFFKKMVYFFHIHFPLSKSVFCI